MSGRLFVLLLIAGLVAAQTGCQSSCGEPRRGLFARHSRCEMPCQTVGRTGGCFDAAPGQPIPYPPEATGVPVPGGAFPYPPIGPIPGSTVPPPDQLHMPAPSDMIRPPAVPIPAPGDASLPYPTSPGTPVKTGPNK
jgi:hypothetical protein